MNISFTQEQFAQYLVNDEVADLGTIAVSGDLLEVSAARVKFYIKNVTEANITLTATSTSGAEDVVIIQSEKVQVSDIDNLSDDWLGWITFTFPPGTYLNNFGTLDIKLQADPYDYDVNTSYMAILADLNTENTFNIEFYSLQDV